MVRVDGVRTRLGEDEGRCCERDWGFWSLQLMKSSHWTPGKDDSWVCVINYLCPIFELAYKTELHTGSPEPDLVSSCVLFFKNWIRCHHFQSGRLPTTTSKSPHFLASLEPSEGLATLDPHSSLAVISYSSCPYSECSRDPLVGHLFHPALFIHLYYLPGLQRSHSLAASL